MATDRSARPAISAQARKLGLAAGVRVRLDDPPAGWRLTDPPAGLTPVVDGPADVVIAFFTAAGHVPPRLPGLAEAISPAGALWLAWPRRAAGHHSDLTDRVLRDLALPLGIVDTKVAALDNDWSGLRFVWRVARRAR